MWAIGRANHITASWVNTDGSTAPLQFLYYKGHGNNNFIVTANADLTQKTFGPGHVAVRDIILQCILYADIALLRRRLRLWQLELWRVDEGR